MRPLILVTNDDGINSPGLIAAVEAVFDLGDVLVSAPHTQQTGMGRAFPRTNEVGIIDETPLKINDTIIKGYGVHGSPAFSVAHGILELADRKPDLCISGINYGENVGLSVTCSGTLGATFEADSHGIPSMAVSIQADLSVQRTNEYINADWSAAKKVLRTFAKKILNEGMPENVNIYNINVPACPKNSNEFRFTMQSRQNYFEFVKPTKRDLNKPYALKSRLFVDVERLERNSDIYALYIDQTTSVTPINTNMSAITREVENYVMGTASI